MGGTADASRHIELGAFGISVLGDGFESLSFSIEKNGEVVTAQAFDTAAGVMAFFAGRGLRPRLRLEDHRQAARALRSRARRRHPLRNGTRLCHRRARAEHPPLLVLGLIAFAWLRRRRAAFSA
jgi:hypothetical protein